MRVVPSPDIGNQRSFLLDCPYAKRYWRGLLASHNFNIISQPGATIVDVWWNAREGMGPVQLRAWDTTWAAGLWALWKKRNRTTFSEKEKPVHILITEAAIDIHNWGAFV